MNHLRSAEAQVLQKAMRDARQALDEAQARYQHAHAIALDTDTSAAADGIFVMQREGRALAQALTQFSKAAMDWLVYVDTQLRSGKAGSASSA